MNLDAVYPLLDLSSTRSTGVETVGNQSSLRMLDESRHQRCGHGVRRQRNSRTEPTNITDFAEYSEAYYAY